MTFLRWLGFVFTVLIIVGLLTHMNGHVWTALAFYVGGVAIMVGLIGRAFLRRF